MPVIEKICTNCKAALPVESFNKNKTKKDGLESWCRPCKNEYKKRYRKSDSGKQKIKSYVSSYREKDRQRLRKRNGTLEYKEYQRKYRKEKADKVKQYKQKWNEENEIQYVIANHIKFAKKKGLYIDWDEEIYKRVLHKFGNKCCLTGSLDDLNMDHFIAIGTGHGGTYEGNMIPLTTALNQTKAKRNPFEWIQNQEEHIKRSFKSVVEVLAQDNKLSPIEFEQFVYWCYENPRTYQRIKKDGKISSLELWKKRK